MSRAPTQGGARLLYSAPQKVEVALRAGIRKAGARLQSSRAQTLEQRAWIQIPAQRLSQTLSPSELVDLYPGFSMCKMELT